MDNNTDLSLVKPDFALVRQMLVDKLKTFKAWKDLMSVGTGTAIVNFISAIGANDQYAIQHAYREAYRTARLDSSIMQQAALVGTRLNRKLPAGTTVTLTSPFDVVIPRFSQFASNSVQLFNRETLNLKANTPTTVALYQGEVKSITLQGTGLPYQMFTSPELNYQVSDIDVEVMVNGVVVQRSVRGVWIDKAAYQDFTTPEGQLAILFGNAEYGVIPGTNAEVKITYILTSGVAGDDAGYTDTIVMYTVERSVLGKAVAPLINGGDQKPVSLYRRLNPQLFAAKTSATTSDEYPAIATKYPGVLDAMMLGQRSVAPGDVRWMNLVQATLLTNKPMTDAQWKEFEKWFQAQAIFPVELYRRDPEPQDTTVFATLYCHGRADLTQVRMAAEKAVRTLFEPRAGMLLNNIFLSDIYSVLEKADRSVEYLELTLPTSHIIVTLESPNFALHVISGTLPAQRRCYAVTSVTPRGETTANFSSVSVQQNSGVSLSWPAERGATSYRVYGGTPTNIGLFAEVTEPRWTDDGTIQPRAAAAPAASTFPPSYARLSGLNIQTAYTDREMKSLGLST